MMSSEAGYTAALMKTAIALGRAERVAEDLPAVCEIIGRYGSFFKNPGISAREKADMLSEMLKEKADELTVEFVAMLALRRRLKHLPGVKRRFIRLVDIKLGRSRVTITLPYEPSDAMMDKLRRHLADIGLCKRSPEAEISFKVIIDRSIIGGFIAESNGKLVDMSIKTRLSRLRLTTH